MIKRRKARQVDVGGVKVGGNAPISVQSMCNTKTWDVEATVKQILGLEEEGCEIVRVTVNTMEAAKALPAIKKQIHIPLVADIHFDYRLALEAAKSVDKLRINPGNIGSKDKVEMVVREAKDRGLPIRIGINGGSLEKDLLGKYGGKGMAEVAVESAMRHIKILEDLDFYDTIVSMKFSDVPRTVEAYEKLAGRVDYPFHLGITEAGTEWMATIKSSVGLGHLLAEGIGDTLRVSITGDVKDEVRVGFEILKSLGLREKGRVFTSCPTCGRTDIDLVGLAEKVEEKTKGIKEPIHIAVMGCVVNGPGEAREADIGVAGGSGKGVIFRKGKPVKTVEEKDILPALMDEVERVLKERGKGKGI